MVCYGSQALGVVEIGIVLDGLAGPACLLADHLVERNGAVGEGNSGDADRYAVIEGCHIAMVGGGIVGWVLVVEAGVREEAGGGMSGGSRRGAEAGEKPR